MTDFLFQIGLSNACFSLALAIVAMLVGARAKRPHLAHLLWLLVFVKLMTPPIVTIPLVTIPQQPETAVAINDHSRPGPPLSNSRELNIDAQPDASLSSKLGSAAWNHARVWLPPIWLLGSVVVFAWSMVRVCRFSRLLAAKSEVAPQELQTAAVKIARRLRLNTIPTICTTSARLSPMVWWTGGKVRIVIPTTLLDQMDAHEWQWVLAHELAHIRRRDYMVRWLEWLACVLFWWNPVVWWAQRNLRAMEEICCDDLVISCLSPKPKFYANSLLSAVEFLARPVLRPPAMASEINSGGFLERRFKMIVSEKPNRSNWRWLQACVLLCAMVVLPLGIASAQDYEAVEKRLGEAVSKGELTLEHAGLMMDALKKEAAKKGTRKITREDLARAAIEIRKAVADGKISAEDGRTKLAGMRKMMAEQGQRQRGGERRRITREGYARAEADLRKAVAERKISGEDARARLEGMRKMMAEQGQHQRGGERQRTTRGDKRAEYEGFERRIKAAVAEGKMTREEAGEKIEGYKKRMAMAERRGNEHAELDAYLEGVWKRLQVGVKEGKLSEEEAKAKMAAIKIEAYEKAEAGEQGERRRRR